jgi:hypothetical protein
MVGQPLDDVSGPAVLEAKLMGGVDWDGEVRIQNSGGGFYLKDYLSQSNFSCNTFLNYL